EASTKRTEKAKVLKDFLTDESDRNNADLRSKEAELAKFISLHPALAARLMQPTQAGRAPVPSAPAGGTAARPTSTHPRLAALDLRAARIERQLAKGAGQPAPGPKLPAFNPPPESAELVAARKDLADKQARFTDKHPDVVAARARLKAAEEAQYKADALALEQ